MAGKGKRSTGTGRRAGAAGGTTGTGTRMTGGRPVRGLTRGPHAGPARTDDQPDTWPDLHKDVNQGPIPTRLAPGESPRPHMAPSGVRDRSAHATGTSIFQKAQQGFNRTAETEGGTFAIPDRHWDP